MNFCATITIMNKFRSKHIHVIILIIVAYFSRTNCAWWSFSQLPVQALGLVGPPICDNIPGLLTGQRRLCRAQPDAMQSVVRGAKLGVRECQWQFRAHRWNCSAHSRDTTVFGRAAHRGNREAAFVYAVSSAGVVHAMTRACSRGELAKCACDPQKTGMGRDGRGEFQWGGCSDNIRYACRFARLFVDAREKRQRDIRAHMNLHNNRAGRRAVKKFVKLQCKCHGVSGSCSTRTCWSTLHEFRRVGSYLKKAYSQAVHVTTDQDGDGLLTTDKAARRPNRNHLVYFENSPNYCVSDPLLGSPGTAGRECNVTSSGSDSCDAMCCGRGYDRLTVRRQSKCDCKFQWCCQVKCRECDEWVDVHTCRAGGQGHHQDTGAVNQASRAGQYDSRNQ